MEIELDKKLNNISTRMCCCNILHILFKCKYFIYLYNDIDSDVKHMVYLYYPWGVY